MRQWIKLAGLCLLLLCGMVNANEVFVTYYHNDHLGSPVAATDETGNLLWREHYRPYGDRQDRPGYQGYGTLGFTGHAQNQANGLVYAGARYYDPLIGRFLSVDPKEASEETPGSFNRYAYSLNNPYGYSDPDGRWVAAALGVLDAGLTIHGIYSEYRSGGVEAAQAEVGKAVAAHLVGGLAGNVLRRGYILAKGGEAKGTLAAIQNFGGRTVNDLTASAMSTVNKEGLTASARALTKHAAGQRTTGTFPRLSGGIEKQNSIAQIVVGEILNNPKSTFSNLSRGGLEVRAPDGRGLRYNSDGSFSGFLDPKVRP
uniref:RHS repeat domain-containing protein n=1 Tax=Pseudomonas sp. RW407 TaxID=2202894 RepID=UPI001314C634|nr:RHS repeat-associated core domain-containing protein [Pseudomonas sp. RW407]